MCWKSEVLKAENSGESKIPIIKVLRMYMDSKELAAYYHGNSYLLNAEYNASILPKPIKGYGFEINEGLHCYSNHCKVNYIAGSVVICTPDCMVFTYNNGRYIGFMGMRHYKPVVVKGYIPPNTIYYINEDYEIVTQKLILTNVLV